MNKENILEIIQKHTDNTPQDAILEDCKKIPCWVKDNTYNKLYIVGLSEDRWDYYWLALTKDKELKFITCCYPILKDIITDIKDFNNDDLKDIQNKINEYFSHHSEIETLLYLNI